MLRLRNAPPLSGAAAALCQGPLRVGLGVVMATCSPLSGAAGQASIWGGGAVFLLEVQYSILKSLISTCVLSYVGSREDWLLDRICES